MLRIERRRFEDLLILDVIGRITSGVPETLFACCVQTALQAGDRQIVVNLERATSADASGLSVLRGASLDARRAGGQLSLMNIRRFGELLLLTPLYTNFDVYDSEEELFDRFARVRVMSAFEPAPAIATA